MPEKTGPDLGVKRYETFKVEGVDLDGPMRIKKLTDCSVLKPGELLVVLHCLNQCGSDALFDLRKSIRIGVVRLYRHRQEPVPWIGRSGNGRLFPTPENNE